MNHSQYSKWTTASLSDENFSLEDCQAILKSPEIELLPLLNAAYEVRKTYFSKEVSIHIINNAQNGFCPEDCHYCAQAKTSKSEIEEYPLKPEAEILAEAKHAYESGAFRYCMVFAGRGPSQKRVEQLSNLIQKIKSQYPIQICVSTGLLDEEKAKQLKAAGLDRLNHNLNTSESNYPNICTTHTYQDRLNTLKAAKSAGLELCSGMIAGLGETTEGIIEVAQRLRELQSPSIPINFLIPIPGTQISASEDLTPEYCLRILCLFRFLNPKAEIRMAAGREIHLDSLQVMGLYPANSLFLEGYLNTKGSSRLQTLKMIKDAGFTIKSDVDLNELLKEEIALAEKKNPAGQNDQVILKTMADLRPAFLKK